jgi:hypothetical protein
MEQYNRYLPHEVLKFSVEKFGIDILCEDRLYGILNDLLISDKKIKRIFRRAIFDDKIGSLVVDFNKESPAQFQAQLSTIIQTLKEDNLYQENVSDYIVKSFLYAIGEIITIDEDIYNYILNPNSKQTDNDEQVVSKCKQDSPTIISFKTSADKIAVGEKVVLKWDLPAKYLKIYLSFQNKNINVFGRNHFVHTPEKDTNYKLKLYDKTQLVDVKDISVVVCRYVSIEAFHANRNSIIIGQSIRLSWNCNNANKIILQPLNLDVTTLSEYNVEPQANTRYSLHCSNEFYNDIAILDVVVYAKPVIKTFNITKRKTKPNEKIELIWATENVENVILHLNDKNSKIETHGKLALQIKETTTIVIQAFSQDNSYCEESRIVVEAILPIEIAAFYASSNTIIESKKTTLCWEVKNSTRVILQPLNKILSEKGMLEVWPRVDTNYYIQAENDFFSERKDIFIFVTPLPRFNTNLIPKLDINKIPVMDVDLSVAKPPIRDIQKLNHVHSVLSKTETELYTPLVNIFSNLSDYFKKWKINF